MRKYILFGLLFFAAYMAQAQDIIYSRTDSLFITRLLQRHKPGSMPAGELVLAIAQEFIGNKYVAGTLEKGREEPLVINTQEVDCTTLVEQVLAIYATTRDGSNSFQAVCSNLQTIRYRNGVRNGYASRLHYISQWITDSAKQHIIEEIDYGSKGCSRQIDLRFMSSHPASYKPLKEDSTLVKEIEKWEKPLRGSTIFYLPKELLNNSFGELPIKNGDIVALTTNIKGLDVTHMGFAFWENGKLHLLHASSVAGKVIKDNSTLYDYQKNKKSQTGIRVFRVK